MAEKKFFPQNFEMNPETYDYHANLLLNAGALQLVWRMAMHRAA